MHALIIGLSSTLPHALSSGLEAHGVAASKAHEVGQTPPISVLFAAFLGYNPIEHLLGSQTLHELPAQSQAVLTGHGFFPHLISGPFSNGLDTAFAFAISACLIAAVASLARGGRYTHTEPGEAKEPVAAPPIRELEESHAR